MGFGCADSRKQSVRGFASSGAHVCSLSSPVRLHLPCENEY